MQTRVMGDHALGIFRQSRLQRVQVHSNQVLGIWARVTRNPKPVIVQVLG